MYTAKDLDLPDWVHLATLLVFMSERPRLAVSLHGCAVLGSGPFHLAQAITNEYKALGFAQLKLPRADSRLHLTRRTAEPHAPHATETLAILAPYRSLAGACNASTDDRSYTCPRPPGDRRALRHVFPYHRQHSVPAESVLDRLRPV
jgi:hypothetical protein